MFREVQQWRVQILAAASTFETKEPAAILRLRPEFSVHDVWAIADVYFKQAGWAARWAAYCRLEFVRDGQFVAEMRIDRSNRSEFKRSGGAPIDQWNVNLETNFERLIALNPIASGAQPALRWGGGGGTGYNDVDVAPYRLRAKATEARLWVDQLVNEDPSFSVEFAIGMKILSHTP